jgi:Zn-dependent protease with chaperone function
MPMEPTSIALFRQALRNSPIAWAGLIVTLASVYVVTRLIAWSSIYVALRPWRRAAAASWVERARLAWPARRLGRIAPGLMILPMWIAVGRDGRQVDLLPAAATNFLVAAAACLGGMHAAIAWGRRLNPSWAITPRPERGAWVLSLSWIGPAFVFAFTLFSLSPTTWDARAWGLLAIGTIAVGTYIGRGWRRSLRWAGVLRPAGDRFREIATRAAGRAGIELRSIEQAALPMVNAFAFVLDRGVAVTDAALAVLDDDELDAVCTHELAHLGEPAWVRAIRLSFGYLMGLYLTLCCLIRPICGSLPRTAAGLIVIGGAVLVLLARVLVLRLAHRMEIRADAQAVTTDAVPGIYGRALAKIYEANLIPVVLGMKRHTHPELYDRLVAAGATPDYPRPAVPPRGPWRAGAAVLILGSVAGGFVLTDLVARRIPRAVLEPAAAASWTAGAGGGTDEEFEAWTGLDFDRGDEEAE